MTDAMLNSLASALQASPADAELRALYGQRLADAGQIDAARGQALVVLSQQPDHAGAAELLRRLDERSSEMPTDEASRGAGTAAPPSEPESRVDWEHLERELGVGVQPPFLDDVDGSGAGTRGEPSDGTPTTQAGREPESLEVVPEPKPGFGVIEITEEGVGAVELDDDSAPVTVSRETMTLDDVGGLVDVKQRIHETFLDPIAHPEIAKAFKKSLGGGLLLYGPPGCGKTFLARAIAGELGAHFISVTLADVLSKYIGENEGNIHKTFVEARQKAPAVLFLDEIDAVGGKRSSQGHQWMRNLVNQLLMEMDGIGSDNEGLFVLAATNMPWDVDPALLRPGRFDRMVLVSPPDAPAREAILRMQLSSRPIEGVELSKLVKATDGFSGADLKHLADTAAEKALAESIKQGSVVPLTMRHINAGLKEVKSSIGPWLDSARNVANFANTDGRYDDLVALLKRMRRL